MNECIEELEDIHLKVQQMADKIASDVHENEDTGENVSSSEVRDIFSMWRRCRGLWNKISYTNLLQAVSATCIMIISWLGLA